MTSNCWNCIFAKGKKDGLTHSPGDDLGDAVWCTNVEFLNKYDLGVSRDLKYGIGQLLYRVEVMVGLDAECEAGIEE